MKRIVTLKISLRMCTTRLYLSHLLPADREKERKEENGGKSRPPSLRQLLLALAQEPRLASSRAPSRSKLLELQ